MSYSPDTYYAPITLTPGTDNVLVVEENTGASSFTVTLIANSDTTSTTAETWYLHDDESLHNAGFYGILYAIKKLLNDGTTSGVGTLAGGTPANTYSWEVIDPTASTGLTNNGIRLKAASAVQNFQVAWTDAATTLDAHYLGSILSSPISDDSSSTSGSDEIFDWPHATLGRMVTRDISDGYATSKRRHRYKDVKYSSSRPGESEAVVWQEGYIRRFRYDWVQPTEVHPTKSAESAYANRVSRATTDQKATWYEVWNALTDGLKVIVVHNSSSDFQVDANSYEVVKLWGPLPWDTFAQSLGPAGDYYAINMALWVDESNADYDH